MTNGWRVARFDEILTKVDRKFIIDDGQEYQTVGVRWYGNGAFVRERLLGGNINRKQQWVIKEGDVVYNKLFAWKGSFAIADKSVDGCIVSDKFPTYHIKSELIDPTYLSYYFTTPQIAMQAQNLSKGAAALSKLTLNPPQFWDLTIPLPPLAEQHRIVEQIKSLEARINEAQHLREAVDADSSLLFGTALKRAYDQAIQIAGKIERLDDLCTRITDGTHVTPTYVDEGIPFLSVKDISSGVMDFSH